MDLKNPIIAIGNNIIIKNKIGINAKLIISKKLYQKGNNR